MIIEIIFNVEQLILLPEVLIEVSAFNIQEEEHYTLSSFIRRLFFISCNMTGDIYIYILLLALGKEIISETLV